MSACKPPQHTHTLNLSSLRLLAATGHLPPTHGKSEDSRALQGWEGKRVSVPRLEEGDQRSGGIGLVAEMAAAHINTARLRFLPLLMGCLLPGMPLTSLSIWLDMGPTALHCRFHHLIPSPPGQPGLLTPTSDSPGPGVAQGQGLGVLSLCTVSARLRLDTEEAPGKDWFRGPGGLRPLFLGAAWGGRCAQGNHRSFSVTAAGSSGSREARSTQGVRLHEVPL